MVRLRQLNRNSYVTFIFISIPHGTIKTLMKASDRVAFAIFQFHMVRLRPDGHFAYYWDTLFQFHMVRLRHAWLNGQPLYFEFQFHMVRLRHTIEGLIAPIDKHFNSTWYD